MSIRPAVRQLETDKGTMPSIEIDGKQLQVRDGIKIIEAADEAGIYIPRFCYHRKLTVAANCRMCLVEVEKAPKPLPACATTVSEGMKVSTRSVAARAAQKSTMEFLLINHPLDCPICDQGGECPLQDQSLGYGEDVSRFTERKNAVVSPDMGPLIATEMTRCINCTRCVRFGHEIAGVMELGMLGRGDRSSIHSFLDESVNSELSGNAIDLCPVGALTSKPYRFTARVWELSSSNAVSPHDSVGSNLKIQSVRGQVKRVLPVVNEAINDCWLSDRDRYSYVGNNSEQRLTKPMIRVDEQWREVSWQVALDFTVTGIKGLIEHYGADQLGALAAPGSTVEEFYLLQKLLRALGSGNIDHRLRQTDFSADDAAPMRPGMELGVEEVAAARSLLLVGANPRKDQPIIGLNIRRASLAGARISSINSMHWRQHFPQETETVVKPDQLGAQLASVLLALDSKCGERVEALAATAPAGDQGKQIAEQLRATGKDTVIVLGSQAFMHAEYSTLVALSQQIADVVGGRMAWLPDANSAAAWLAGCVPHRGVLADQSVKKGMDVAAMLAAELKGYILLGLEPELDCLESMQAAKAMEQADFVVSLSPFHTAASDYADVQLPIASFSETSGTYISAAGIVQSMQAAVTPPGESRPAWKVLRVLANNLQLDDFDYQSSAEVLEDMALPADLGTVRYSNIEINAVENSADNGTDVLQRITDMPLYRIDAMVRRATPLQQTQDNPGSAVRINAQQAEALGLTDVQEVLCRVDGVTLPLALVVDERVPTGCTWIPLGYHETAPLDGACRVRLGRK